MANNLTALARLSNYQIQAVLLNLIKHLFNKICRSKLDSSSVPDNEIADRAQNDMHLLTMIELQVYTCSFIT